MTPTTPADASPAAGEIVAWLTRGIANLRDEWADWQAVSPKRAAAWLADVSTRTGRRETIEVVRKSALDSSRAETDAMRAERDDANARAEGLEQTRIKIPLTALERAKRTEALEAERDALLPYRTELLKIAADVGEDDDPFAAWEAVAALEAELSEANKARAIWAYNAGNSADEAMRLRAEVADLKAKLAMARETLTTVMQNNMSRERARTTLAAIGETNP